MVLQGGGFGDFEFDFKHQLVALGLGFHRFGGELRIGGDKGNPGGEHGVEAVEHDTRFTAHFQTAHLAVGQEDIHRYVGRVEQPHHFVAGGNHAADFGDAVFHQAGFGAADGHVLVGRGGFGFLRTGGVDGGQRFGARGFGGLHRSGGAVAAGAAFAHFAVGYQIFAAHIQGVIQFELRHFQLLLVRPDFGIGACGAFLRPLFLRFGGGHAAFAGVGRQLGQHVAFFHDAAFVHRHGFDAAGIEAGDV